MGLTFIPVRGSRYEIIDPAELVLAPSRKAEPLDPVFLALCDPIIMRAIQVVRVRYTGEGGDILPTALPGVNRQLNVGQEYTLILDGVRRAQAARRLGHPRIYVLILDFPSWEAVEDHLSSNKEKTT